jgi:hypothetical protein
MRRTRIEHILSALPPVSDRRADIRNRQLRAISDIGWARDFAERDVMEYFIEVEWRALTWLLGSCVPRSSNFSVRLKFP